MPLRSLKPEVSIPAALATGTLVFVIYSRGLPPGADLRLSEPGDPDIEAVRKQNAWTSAAVVSGVALIARDTNIFVVGGMMTVALDWFTRHSTWVNPITKQIDGAMRREDMMQPSQQQDETLYGPNLGIVG